MPSPDQVREEEQFREIERAMLYVDDAARKVAATGKSLKADRAPAHLVEALEAAAEALRADHRKLMRSVYWKAPAKAEHGDG